MHFTAFHPDWKMPDPAPIPSATLTRARHSALTNGVRYAYTGNVKDPEGGSTLLPSVSAAGAWPCWEHIVHMQGNMS
jgi:pyruvate formate lyase activating enzyme